MCRQDFLIQNDELVQYLGTDTEVTVPNTVKKINRGVFYNCANVTSVTLPVSLKQVCRSAFHRCEDLNLVRYLGTEAHVQEINFARGNEALLRAERIVCGF